jgi:hypothetical protein
MLQTTIGVPKMRSVGTVRQNWVQSLNNRLDFSVMRFVGRTGMAGLDGSIGFGSPEIPSSEGTVSKDWLTQTIIPYKRMTRQPGYARELMMSSTVIFI